MNRRPNAWHEAICTQLRMAQGPLGVDQIWARMEAAGFQHASKRPRSTLGARIAGLAQLKKIERVGPATYQIIDEKRALILFSESQQEARIHAAMTKKLGAEGP
jgi:hypothetical protein